MKWVRYVLLAMLIGPGATATAQRRFLNNNVRELRQRMNELQLTMEQKRKLAILIRRERMQF